MPRWRPARIPNIRAAQKPPFPPFNKETFASQLVWLVIFFVALYVLMSRLALPRIGGIIEARSARDRRRSRRGASG